MVLRCECCCNALKNNSSIATPWQEVKDMNFFLQAYAIEDNNGFIKMFQGNLNRDFIKIALNETGKGWNHID